MRYDVNKFVIMSKICHDIKKVTEHYYATLKLLRTDTHTQTDKQPQYNRFATASRLN